MRNPKILGLNTDFESLHFPNFQEDIFSSKISLLDYDAVIIDSTNLIDQYVDGPYQKKFKKNDIKRYISYRKVQITGNSLLFLRYKAAERNAQYGENGSRKVWLSCPLCSQGER